MGQGSLIRLVLRCTGPRTLKRISSSAGCRQEGERLLSKQPNPPQTLNLKLP